MKQRPHPQRACPPLVADAISHDRLETFRLLFLGLAAFATVGLALSVGLPRAASAAEGAIATVGAALLVSVWYLGYHRGRFSLLLLAAETILLGVVIFSLKDEVAALGCTYLGVQFRALYGGRRDTTAVTGAYLGLFLVNLAVLPGGGGLLRPVVAIEILAFSFCAYLMHTLAEVLSRDLDRTMALHESQQRFRSVAENLREAIMITDLDDRVVFANSRVREILGYAPEEMTGRKATDLLLPDDRRAAFTDRLLERLDGKSERYEIELKRRDGVRIFAEVSASPYRDGTGQVIGTLGAISDVTDQKRLEARLQQAMRMEAIGQLAGGVAHDFNNLLTVIKLHTELLLAELEEGSTRESIVEIEKSASRGARLTQQLLAFGRKQMLQPRRVVLADVVEQALPVLRRILGRRAIIDARSDDARGQIFADPQQIEQVLATLVRNADEAMPDGGTITIETRAMHLTDDHESEMPTGQYAILSVRDTGVGMSEEVKAHIFEPFFTTKGPGRATGLGLASLYGIVRQSGGFVDVESAPGRGTTVRVFLPYAPPPGAAIPVAVTAPR